MVNPIPESVRDLWDKWNIRGVILFSLSLQAFLILFAPFQKGTANKLIILLLWLAYLLADLAANFGVGLIAESRKDAANASTPAESNDLLALWAPFLLLHLGGPDTITAFALEDNELWLRHLLGFIVQAVAAVYIFLLSLPRNKLFMPTILMFIAGTIKYFERTRALYLASFAKFQDLMLKDLFHHDDGPNYANLMEEYASYKEAKIVITQTTYDTFGWESIVDWEVTDNIFGRRLDCLEVTHYAYKYFNCFKRLIVDYTFSYRERYESRAFLNSLKDPKDAFRIIEVELNFIYEVFHTKIEVIRSVLGYIFRFISFSSVVAALSIFHFKSKKQGFDGFDVGVTYTLFLGAVALDTIVFFILIFSDWVIVDLIRNRKKESRLGKIKYRIATILRWLLILKSPWWQKCHTHYSDCAYEHELLATPFLFRRWSGSVSGHSLIRHSLKSRPISVLKIKTGLHLVCQGIIHYLGIDRLILSMAISIHDFIHSCGIDKIFHNIVNVTNSVIQFLRIYKVIHLMFLMLEKLLHKIRLGDVMDDIRVRTSLSHEPFTKELWLFILDEIKRIAPYADDPKAAEKIYSAEGKWILRDCDPTGDYFDLLRYFIDIVHEERLLYWHIATDLLYHSTEEVADQKTYNAREFSKLLSDYMLYLLVLKPTMVNATAGIPKIIVRDTCAEAKRFFAHKSLKPNQMKEACEKILAVNTSVNPVALKGDRSKSVLFDACVLAKELAKLEGKWELLSKLWVQFLFSAASQCSGRTHAQQLANGGELTTFVWLLMAHFGLSPKFEAKKDHVRAKLVVG